MKSLQEIWERGNAVSVNLLLTDAEMALTFLDLARASQNEEHRRRRIYGATKAYSFIQKRIPTVTLTATENIALNRKMSLLKLRLGLS